MAPTSPTEAPLSLVRARELLARALALPAGASPFPWQQRLLSAFVEGRMPRALDVPTGLGKTAVMAVWLVARAAGAAVPRRLVYVVDRRAVVDQATHVAEGLRGIVDADPALQAALGLEKSLPISTLRGQFVDNREWLDDPSSPAIVLGTIDMVGSRLLFSGYGVSRKMRPYHAGLLGADSLIVLDEAHLVPAFERLIERVASGVDSDERPLGALDSARPLVPRLHCMSLSATGRDRVASTVLQLDADDEAHPDVKRRLTASKQLELRRAVAEKELPDALADAAWSLIEGAAVPSRIIVFCDLRDHAQKVHDALEKRAKSGTLADVELFVGGRRVFERERVADYLATRGFIAGSEGRPERATFIVATSAGEVGVDLDADHAVCDLVAWERMVQRLGRVNRRGAGSARVIVIPAERPATVKDDQLPRWERHAATALVLRELSSQGDSHDASPGAIVALKRRAATDAPLAASIEAATTPAPLYPPLSRALVEAWAMTSLEEHTGRPNVGPWIRGWREDEEPQTTVVWRRHLPLLSDGSDLSAVDREAYFEAAPPHIAEKLEVETWRAAAWLDERLAHRQKVAERGDAQASPPAIAAVVVDSGEDPVFRIRGDAEIDRARLERQLTGATLIVDVRVGGLTSGLLDAKSNEAVLDLTDPAHGDAPGATQRAFPFRMRSTQSVDDLEASEGFRVEATLVLARNEDVATEWLVIESSLATAALSEEGRSAAPRAQLLEDHQTWAEDDAAAIARRLQLPPDYATMLAVAARLHDEGKRAPQWQAAFSAPNGGRPPYGKTRSRPKLSLLDGYRHELGSLPFAERDARVAALAPELRELCLHLIAAHHGHARPTIRTAGASEPPSKLAARAREIALRFDALEQRWGPWGLAWWEALLRAADQRASKRNDQAGAHHG